MASQKTRPGPGTPERRKPGQRHRSAGTGIGDYVVLVTVLVVVAVVVASLFALSSGHGTPEAVQLGQPSATEAATGDTTGSASDVAEGPNGFRPEGSEPAAPEHGKKGKLVMSDTSALPSYAVYVFADGRVIWRRRTGGVSTTTPGWLERRLTPKGLDLLQPGATPDMGESSNPRLLDPFGLPVGAWEDPTPEPYRASHYAVCPSRFSDAAIWHLLPAPARDLLRGSEGIIRGREGSVEGSVGFGHQDYTLGCPMVVAEDARRLERILVNHGFKRDAHRAPPGLREYRIGSTASVGVFPALPNATFEVWG